MSLFTVISVFCAVSCLFYVLIIGVFTLGWFRLKSFTQNKNDKFETISVIVPFRNEENFLPDFLESLLYQCYPPQFLEIILVDDHSTDSGVEIVQHFIEYKKLSNFILLRLSESDGLSKKAALKKGIEHSHGELIVTTDADCTMGNNWLNTIVSFYHKENCALISAPVMIKPEKSFFSKIQTLEFFSLVGCGAGAISVNTPFLANGANLIFERNLYDELQGYSSHIEYTSGDDVFMLIKAKKNHKIGFLKDYKSAVFTKGSMSLKHFFYQRVRWASKSKGYHDTIALTTTLSVFLFNMSIVATIVLSFYNYHFLLLCGLLFLIKAIIDFPLLLGVSVFFKSTKMMWFYSPMQVLYPFYIVTTAVLSLFISFEWKGRKHRQ
ncbi:MAG: glycosyltransferase [Bacteroidota bacterium]